PIPKDLPQHGMEEETVGREAKDDRRTRQDPAKNETLAIRNQIEPLRVILRKFFFVVDALIEAGEISLVKGDGLGGGEDGFFLFSTAGLRNRSRDGGDSGVGGCGTGIRRRLLRELGVRGKVGGVEFFRVELSGEGGVLFGERGNEDVGLGLGVLQELFLGVERRPLLEAMNKAELVFGGLRKDFFRVFARFVRLFVRLLHLFYSFTLIAAGVGKVAIGVVN